MFSDASTVNTVSEQFEKKSSDFQEVLTEIGAITVQTISIFTAEYAKFQFG